MKEGLNRDCVAFRLLKEGLMRFGHRTYLMILLLAGVASAVLVQRVSVLALANHNQEMVQISIEDPFER